MPSEGAISNACFTNFAEVAEYSFASERVRGRWPKNKAHRVYCTKSMQPVEALPVSRIGNSSI